VSVYNNFWHTYYQEYRPSTGIFIFHLTYCVHLLYLGKLSTPKHRYKLNKIMKISQEDAILMKNLYLPKQYRAQRLLSEFPDKGWKLGSIDSLLKRIVWQPGSGRPRSAPNSGGPCGCAQSGGQPKKASISS